MFYKFRYLESEDILIENERENNRIFIDVCRSAAVFIIFCCNYTNVNVASEHLLVIKEEDFQKMSAELKNAYREIDRMEEWHILTTGTDTK